MWVQVPSSAYLKVHPFGWIFFCIKVEYEFELDCFKVSDSFFVSICLDKYSVCNLNASTNISPEKKKFKKVVDFLESPLYTNKRAKEHEAHKKCRSGGIGRRAGFRCLWSLRPCGFKSHLLHLFLFYRDYLFAGIYALGRLQIYI